MSDKATRFVTEYERDVNKVHSVKMAPANTEVHTNGTEHRAIEMHPLGAVYVQKAALDQLGNPKKVRITIEAI